MTGSSSRANRRALCCVAATYAFLAVAANAGAEPSASNVETARAAYVEGKALRAAGDHTGALEKFKAAYLLAPTPITGLELGREFIFHANLVEAREVLLTIERMPQRSDESAKAKAARLEAQKLAEKLRTTIPALSVHLVEPPVITAIEIDDEKVPKEALASARRLNPGKHVVVVRGAGNQEARLTVEIVENEQRSISIALKEPADTPGAAPAPAGSPVPSSAPAAEPTRGAVSAPAKPEESRTAGRFVAPSWLFPAGLATAGVGLFVGGVTGGIALSEASVLRDRCPGGRCPPDVHEELRTVDTLGTISTIAFIVAGVGAAATIVALVFGDKDPRPQALRARAAWTF